MLEINQISKIFTNKKEIVIADKDISIYIPKGSIIGLLGANGAGKTTLVKMICNLITPSSGYIKINGNSIHEEKNIVHDNVGVLLEGARNLYNFLTVEENLNYFSYLNEIEENKIQSNKEYLLKLFDLESKRYQTVNSLSRGMQQKVALIVAILKDPDILILDEPTLGLDITSKIKMKELLKRLAKEFNKTLIISSHDISLIKDICDKVAILNQGKLIKYENLHSLNFESDLYEYEIIVKNQDYLKVKISNSDLKIEEINENFIKLTSNNIADFLKTVDPNDLYKIERKDNNLEFILKGLGDKSEDSKTI